MPSVPPFATPSNPRFQNLHRLTYHASGTLISPSSPSGVLKLEIPLETRDVESDIDVTNADMEHGLRASGTPQMWTGYQSEVDVLMPHRLDDTPTDHASWLTSIVDLWTSDSPSKTFPRLLTQPSLLFYSNTSQSWTHSERMTTDSLLLV